MSDTRDNDCAILTRVFKGKFGVYPDIRFVDTNGYGLQYCLFKTNIMTQGMIPYYKLSDNLKSAIWFIDNWKVVPASVITFLTIQQRNEWRKAEKVRMYQQEMNALFSDKFDEEITQIGK